MDDNTLIKQLQEITKEYYEDCACWISGWGPCPVCRRVQLLNDEQEEKGIL